MKTIWYQKNPEDLDELKKQLAIYYPSLHVFNEQQIIYVRGNFPIQDPKTKKLIDQFKIEMKIPNTYPVDIPTVKEVGGKIPAIADRHFYPSGRACLFMPEERYRYFPTGATLFEFIEGPVKDFFISQTNFILTGKWPFGERPHDALGVIDYYSAILGTKNEKIITLFLIYLYKKEVKGHWLCYCGSGKILRKCHFEKLKEIRNQIKPNDVKLSLYLMVKKIKNKRDVN